VDPSLYIPNPKEARLVEGYFDDLPLDDGGPLIKPDTSNLDVIYEKQHKNFDENEYFMSEFGVRINYEDDFRNKTNKQGKVITRRVAPGTAGPGRKKGSKSTNNPDAPRKKPGPKRGAKQQPVPPQPS
jgi:hypothetical protein